MSRSAGTNTGSRSPDSLWLALAMLALTIVVFAPVRHFEFVNWDDPTYITENANVTAGLTWPAVGWALTTGHAPYWHPMTWLSHLLDVQLYGLDPGPHHVTSLMIHLANVVLVFWLLRNMTGATGRSAFVASVFAVHPVHVESVAWIAERKDVLSTLFWALTIAAYLRYVRRPRLARYLAVVALFALALASKPMVVTLPIVLLLLDVWPLGRAGLVRPDLSAWKRLVLEKLPLLLLAIATSAATVIVQHRIGAMAGLGAVPWSRRVSNAIVACVEYVQETLWPARLAPFYPPREYSSWIVTAAALALTAATLFAFRARERRPYLLVGWLWYLVTLAPVIGLLQAGEQRLADRFLYVPMLGLLVIVAWGVPDLLERWYQRRTVLPQVAIAVVIVCAVIARAQVQHWADSVTLWRHAIRVTPDSYIAFENLGQALRERGQLEEARASYLQARALAPGGSPLYQAVISNSLGLVLTRQGRTREAVEEFETAVRLRPEFGEARINLGNALAGEGRFDDAIAHYRAAVRIAPESTEALVGLGNAFLSQGKSAEAIEPYMRALALDPGLAQAHNGLGAALAMKGDSSRAMQHYAEALRLKPDLPTAHLNVAVLLIRQGRIDEAKGHLETALAIDSRYQPARDLLVRVGGGS